VSEALPVLIARFEWPTKCICKRAQSTVFEIKIQAFSPFCLSVQFSLRMTLKQLLCLLYANDLQGNMFEKQRFRQFISSIDLQCTTPRESPRECLFKTAIDFIRQPFRILFIDLGCCGVVGSTLAFGSTGHRFKSEHRLFSHHGASAFSKLISLAQWTIQFVDCCSSLS